MKKIFVFDKCEDELLSVDESTVLIDTGIDAERVKGMIMKEIKGGKKKASVKKLFSIVFIAAAITAAATVTAMAATGGFNTVFGALFAGEPANGVFPGTDISVKSDTLDIEFLGVTGDEMSMISVYDIRKKDGSNFVDTFDTPEDYRFLNVRAKVDLTESEYRKLKEMIEGGACGRYGYVLYQLLDEKTIRAWALFEDDKGCIRGERLTVTDKETIIYHIDEVLYDGSDDTYTDWLDYEKKNKDLILSREAAFEENQQFFPIGEVDRTILAVTSATTIPLEYELDVTLNYRTIEKTFPKAKGKVFSEQNTEWKVNKIKAGAFGMTIEAVTDHVVEMDGIDVMNSANWSPEEAHDYMEACHTEVSVEITLKDGTKIRAEGSGEHHWDPNGKTKSSWSCSYCKDGDMSKPYTLDPHDIISITCNGTELL